MQTSPCLDTKPAALTVSEETAVARGLLLDTSGYLPTKVERDLPLHVVHRKGEGVCRIERLVKEGEALIRKSLL